MMSSFESTARWRIMVCRLCLAGWLSLPGLLLPRAALADLMLYPTRIVFEKNQRAAQVELVNNGQESATYRISIVNRRMTENGDFVEVDQPLPDERFAHEILRYSPRQITLAPGATQTVRIMVRKRSDLAVGEYRSHLQFDRLPPPGGTASIEAPPSANEEQIGVQLRALVGASIPVIVRHGETTANVTISHLRLHQPEDGTPAILSLQMNRSGNRSVYGDLIVSYTPLNGSPQVIGKAGGVAVYTPNPLRRAQLTLQPQPGVSLNNGTLHVVYRERPQDGGKLLAEAELALP